VGRVSVSAVYLVKKIGQLTHVQAKPKPALGVESETSGSDSPERPDCPNLLPKTLFEAAPNQGTAVKSKLLLVLK